MAVSRELTTRSRYHVEDVGGVTIEHSEVFEVVSSLDHQNYVDPNDKVESEEEGFVVLPVAGSEVVGQLLLEGLVPGLSSRGLWGNEPPTCNTFLSQLSDITLKNSLFYENLKRMLKGC